MNSLIWVILAAGWIDFVPPTMHRWHEWHRHFLKSTTLANTDFRLPDKDKENTRATRATRSILPTCSHEDLSGATYLHFKTNSTTLRS